MLFRILILSVATALYYSCDSPVEKNSEKSKIIEPASAEFDELMTSDSCLCDFHEFGSYKISNENYNIYLSGKGWNQKSYSCSYAWGEDVNNIFVDDTNVIVLKIHLLDLKEFNVPDNSTEFGNDSIRKYVIATYTRDKKKHTDNCIFDPYQTGKYSKPVQWIDN